MYVYNVGYHSYEPSNYIQLTHEKKFSKKQFELIVFGCVDLAIQKNMNKVSYYHIHDFDNAMDTVAECMVSGFGFKYLEYTQRFECFGWGSLFYNDGWKHETTGNIKRLRRYLKKRGYTKEDDGMRQMDKEMKEEYKKEKKESKQ